MSDHQHPMQPPMPDPTRLAPICDDQIPLFSQVGRGLRGNSYKVGIYSDSPGETYLEGLAYDAITKSWTSEWVSNNINGGHLQYHYNLRTFSSPQTFTITFRYDRPNRSESEWIWTTPAIPYLWDADNDGVADVGNIIGSGVSTLFLKKTSESWPSTYTYTAHTPAQAKTHLEKLLYPTGWTREMFNAPVPGDPWTVNLDYGVGGDIDAPNIDDLAKVLGITVNNIRNIVANSPTPTETIPDQNLKKYIDRRDAENLAHIHSDLGFGDHLKEDKNNQTYTQKFGNKQTVSTPTVKQYIDAAIDDMATGIGEAKAAAANAQEAAGNARTAATNAKNAADKANASIAAIVNKIFGGGTINSDGTITWPNSDKIAIGDLNVFGGDSTPTTNQYSNALRTRALSNNDVWAR